MTDDIEVLLQQGKLEQTCNQCGRNEAAGTYCSWCGKPMSRDDWYRDPRDADGERFRRMPKTAPANPPTEFRRASHWPPTWGPYPYKPPRPGQKAQGGPEGSEVD